MDLMNLTARLSLDSSAYEQSLNQAKGGLSDLAGTMKKVIAGLAFGAIAKKSFDTVISMTKKAVKSYARYEQLVGGVNKLYGGSAKSFEEYAETAADSMYKMGQRGEDIKKLQEELIKAGYDLGEAGADGIYGPKTKAAFEEYAKAGGRLVREAYDRTSDASTIILENAQEAWKTAGMSANDYLDTVTSFSAALIQSLDGDTVAAAEYADQAIRDMSDNANTFGTNIESIQSAYQGFAKQNYTMLDNLKLGYGGTKSEMERLIKDAEALDSSFTATRDANGKLTLSFDDIVQAIHIVQEDMGIAGTTINEANTTIEGSINALRATWENLLLSLASGEDITGNVDNFSNATITAIDNIMPVVEKTLEGIGAFIEKVGPKLIDELPGIISSLLPGMIDAVTSLVGSLVKGLPGILSAFTEAITDAAGSLLRKAIGAITGENLGDSADLSAKRIIDAIVTGLGKLTDRATDIAKKIREIVTNAMSSENLHKLFDDGGTVSELASKIVQGIIDGIGTVVNGAKKIGLEIVGLLNDVPWGELGTSLGDTTTRLIDQLFSGLSSDDFASAANTIGQMLGSAIVAITDLGINFGTAIVKWLISGDALQQIYNIGTTLAQQLTNGIANMLLGSDNPIVQYFGQLFQDISDLIEHWNSVDMSQGTGNWRGVEMGGQPTGNTTTTVNEVEVSHDQIQEAIDNATQKGGQTIVTINGVEMDVAWAEQLLAETEPVSKQAGEQMSSAYSETDLSGLVQNIGLAGEKGGSEAASNLKEEIEGQTYSIDINANLVGLPGGANKPEKHAKSMSGGSILRGATVFGLNSKGQPLIGGEAGPEAIVGVTSLNSMIQSSVASAMASVLGRLDTLISGQGRQDNRPVILDTGVLVGEMGGAMNRELGSIAAWKGGNHA